MSNIEASEKTKMLSACRCNFTITKNAKKWRKGIAVTTDFGRNVGGNVVVIIPDDEPTKPIKAKKEKHLECIFDWQHSIDGDILSLRPTEP